jgi:hypothetical protein
MSEAMRRSIEAQAQKILRMERALVVVTGALTLITLGASIYFEKSYGVPPYSTAIVVGFFLVSYACFWALFSFFKGDFQQRAPGKGKARMALWAASIYIAIAATAAYIVAFGMLGLAGFFKSMKAKAGLYIGIAVAALLRMACHVVSGVVFFASNAADANMPVWSYSIVYNSFVLVDAAICLVLAFLAAPRLLKLMKAR